MRMWRGGGGGRSWSRTLRHSHPPSSAPWFTLRAQRWGEGADARAQQGAPKGSRRIVGCGRGARRGPALGKEGLGPFGQGADTGRADTAQEVKGRGGTLLSERAGARGRRTAEGAACSIEGAGPGRGRAVRAAVGIRLQVELGAR